MTSLLTVQLYRLGALICILMSSMGEARLCVCMCVIDVCGYYGGRVNSGRLIMQSVPLSLLSMTSPIHKREDWELQLSTLWKSAERGRDVSIRVVYETDTRGKAKNQSSYRKPLNGKMVFNQSIIFLPHIF